MRVRRRRATLPADLLEPRQSLLANRPQRVRYALLEVGPVGQHEPSVGPVVRVAADYVLQAFAVQSQRGQPTARVFAEWLEPGLRERFRQPSPVRHALVLRRTEAPLRVSWGRAPPRRPAAARLRG